jgi:hypothetical protein
MGLRSTQGDENGFGSATALHGSVALPFVIPTGVHENRLKGTGFSPYIQKAELMRL